jgi:hypothetical protein
MEGFYAAYLAGRSGNSMLLFIIRGTTFTGVDVGGLKYDGSIVRTDNGLKCTVVYAIPAGASLITGASPPASEHRIPLEFDLVIVGNSIRLASEVETGDALG